MSALVDLCRRSDPAERAPCADRRPKSPLVAMEALAQGRTAALGGPVDQCTACGALESSSHACKNRPCPTCHNDATTR
jgi:hypothetical protein